MSLAHQNEEVMDEYRLNVLKGNVTYSGNPSMDKLEHKIRSFLLFAEWHKFKGHVQNFVDHVIVHNWPELAMLGLALGGAFGKEFVMLGRGIVSVLSKMGKAPIWSAMKTGLADAAKVMGQGIGLAGKGLGTVIVRGGWVSVAVMGLAGLLVWRFINVWDEQAQEEYFKEGTMINEGVETNPLTD